MVSYFTCAEKSAFNYFTFYNLGVFTGFSGYLFNFFP